MMKLAVLIIAAALVVAGIVAAIVWERVRRMRREAAWTALVARAGYSVFYMHVVDPSHGPAVGSVGERMHEVVAWWSARHDEVKVKRALAGCVLEFVTPPLFLGSTRVNGYTDGKHIRVSLDAKPSPIYGVGHEVGHRIANVLLGIDGDDVHAYFNREGYPWS